MSLDIDQIALHQLIKRDEQNLELVLRESLLEPNATVVEMMAELHRVYSAKSKAYGLLISRAQLRSLPSRRIPTGPGAAPAASGGRRVSGV